MEFRRRRLIAITVAAVVSIATALVVAVAVWALYDPEAGEATGTDAHIEIEPGADAAGVAQDAMTAMYSWRPAGQEGPWDSMHAASHLYTGKLGQMAAQRPEDEPLPTQWLAWAEDNARITAATEATDTRIDGTSGQVDVVVRQRVMHNDGDVTPLPDMSAVVDVVDTPEGWKAENFQLQAVN